MEDASKVARSNVTLGSRFRFGQIIVEKPVLSKVTLEVDQTLNLFLESSSFLDVRLPP